MSQFLPVYFGDFVEAGGGGGVIAVNPFPGFLFAANYVIPAVHVQNDAGETIRAYLDSAGPAETVTISFTEGTEIYDSDPRVTADMMSGFSSRGPTVQGSSNYIFSKGKEWYVLVGPARFELATS